MKKQIETLVKLGISETEALTIVRNIAILAFEEGENNMHIYGYGNNAEIEAFELFDDWFKKRIK